MLGDDPMHSYRVIHNILLDAEAWILDKNVMDCSVPTARLISWVWPPQGFIKLNVDGSSQGNPGLAGFGGLARSDDGKWIFGFYGSIGFAGNLLPELIAICQGLRLAWDRGFRCVLCESDSMEAIRLIHSSDVHFHHF